MKEFLKIGLIQPVIDPDLFWDESAEFIAEQKKQGKPTPYKLNINPLLAEKVWYEIKDGISSLIRIDNRPDIILIPELHLPVSRVADLSRISKRTGVLIIAGLDFERNQYDPKKIRNRGVMLIPRSLGSDRSNRITTHYFGKTYFTYMERSMFTNVEGVECREDREQNMYIFKTKEFGNFGIMICSDVFDIERMILYQGRIHHLFIISLNKDLNTYFAMAETLTRLLYCNVIVCNTGQYGGSLAFSPFDDTNDRIIYKYHGQKNFTTHHISVPIKSLSIAQGFDFVNGDKKKSGIKFKATPPGYSDKYQGILAQGIIEGTQPNQKVVDI